MPLIHLGHRFPKLFPWETILCEFIPWEINVQEALTLEDALKESNLLGSIMTGCIPSEVFWKAALTVT